MTTRILEGKNIVVTGGAGALGASYSMALAKHGASVTISDLQQDAAEKIAVSIRQAREHAIAIAADVTNAEDVERLLDACESEFGPIDVLVNLAGMLSRKPLIELGEQEWDAVMKVNVKSIYLASQAALRRMLVRKQGSIINAASGSGVHGIMNGSAYSASKGAIIAFTKAVALELEGTGVRMNCFGPGPTESSIWREGRAENEIRRLKDSGLVYEADEFANIIVFLASDLSWPLNGQFLNRERPK